MKKTSLVIMAAGIGSRFGGGIKQLAPVGPSGEIIMDYSIHDALEAGFDKIIFIIRKDLEKDFKEIIGNRIEKIAPVEYAYQEMDDLPEGFSVPEGRKKPWGTGQAILACKDIVKELDLMGYMEMKGNKRTVSFTPNEKYYAKNALNLPPVIEVPNTASGNTFFQDKIVAAVAEKRRQEAELLADYESLKNIIETKVGEIKDIAGLNEIYGEIRGLQVIWDSQFFANKLLKEKSVELKAKYSKETGKFEVADE